MKMLVELDEATYRRLEQVAPAKSRARSAFIRTAIQKSLWELEEERTRRAYLDTPDAEPIVQDSRAWEPLAYGGFDPPKSVPPVRRARRRAQVAPSSPELASAPPRKRAAARSKRK